MRMHEIETMAFRQLGVPMAIVLAETAAVRERLSATERARLESFRFEQRRKDWLVGRAALKELLPALGRDNDTGRLSFPDRQLSLTHGASRPGGTIAIAAGTAGECAGIGVDYEPNRPIAVDVARWFLGGPEIEWLDARPRAQQAGHILRLWTVKEAAFKSCPDNAGRALHEFAIDDAASVEPRVRIDDAGIRVTTRRFASGYLSIAVNRGRA